MNKFLKDNIMYIGGFLVVLLLVGIFAIVVAFVNSEKNTNKKFDNTMRELGKIFYEDHYYDIIVNSKGTNYLKQFSDNGLVVDLATLKTVNTKTKELAEVFVDKNNNELCNSEKTKVIIKTNDPYGKSDYSMEVTLDCKLSN